MNSVSFGIALKAVRSQRALSQDDLAGELSSTQRHISFLETGRSAPTREMIQRICRTLMLGPSERATLYEASGFHNPYVRRDLGSAEIAETLDMLENHVLAHWPFPAFVLDEDWGVLRLNRKATKMFGPLFGEGNQQPNLLDVITSDAFFAQILNWQEASTAMYARLQKHSQTSEPIKATLKRLEEAGRFAHIADYERDLRAVPIFVPLELAGPDGVVLRISSIIGELASVTDAAVAGCTIELLCPIDAPTEHCLQVALAD